MKTEIIVVSIKKTATFVILLLANFLMLVAVVVPHHHHEQSRVCIEWNHCECSHDMDREETTEHSHDGADDCFLKHQVTEPRKSIESIDAYSGPVHPATSLCFSLLKSIFTQPITNTGKALFIPGKIPLYSGLLFSSYGLRAPPTV